MAAKKIYFGTNLKMYKATEKSQTIYPIFPI